MLPVSVARRRATALDVLWNAEAALAAATVAVACAPTRLWAAGCALQCLLHMACVIVELWSPRGTRVTS
ncbi:hypothetical protein E2562_010032 [Oryza meyeriana var. granulata]|uniref:Uncharacterized protein n=1 Tax=Oryza meyeriana var. granulata TaxID=110450 RepID=A0A6G1EHQ1_9ORYZ|nr:hypothetical protein E2562_010032 [Oryza meyeriana var. granulata]